MANLNGKTLFITGASRGIGLAIANRAALDGANVSIVAKTVVPHPKLPGTIYSAAEEINANGGRALSLPVDIRFEDQVEMAIRETVSCFGGIDIVVNNASAINLMSTEMLTMKNYDLMHSINTRGTFLCSKLAIPHLKRAKNPHVMNLSPPLNMESRWFQSHVAYTMPKWIKLRLYKKIWKKFFLSDGGIQAILAKVLTALLPQYVLVNTKVPAKTFTFSDQNCMSSVRHYLR